MASRLTQRDCELQQLRTEVEDLDGLWRDALKERNESRALLDKLIAGLIKPGLYTLADTNGRTVQIVTC